MKFSLFLPPGHDVVVVSARAEAPDGTVGQINNEVRPGQSIMGWSYQELRALGTGWHELGPKAPPVPDS